MVNSLQAATLTGAATSAGHALQYAYKRKIQGAEEDCRKQGIVFLPLAAEALGGWHEVAVEQIGKLGAAVARHSGQEEGEATSQLWQKLSVSLMKGNAALLTNRIPSIEDFVDA